MNNKTHKNIAIAATVFGFLAVLFGAFGAHGLKQIVTVAQQRSFETAVRYQMYHGLALLFLSLNTSIAPKKLKVLYRCFFLGTLLFSGSIYLLVLDDILGISMSFLGPITPIGGSLLLVGWGLLFWQLLKQP